MEKVYLAHHKKFKTLDLNDRVGMTDYIDFIEESEMTNSVMVGVDTYQRPFFVMKFKVIRKDGTQINCFQTFFRRYTDNNLWLGCSDFKRELFDTCGGINSDQIELLNNLLEHNKVIVTDNEAILSNYKFAYRKFFDSVTKNSPVEIEFRE